MVCVFRKSGNSLFQNVADILHLCSSEIHCISVHAISPPNWKSRGYKISLRTLYSHHPNNATHTTYMHATYMSRTYYIHLYVTVFQYITFVIYESWPLCDCLIAFYSSGYPLKEAETYASLRKWWCASLSWVFRKLLFFCLLIIFPQMSFGIIIITTYLGDITLDKVPRSRRSDTVEWCSSKDKKFGIVTESSFWTKLFCFSPVNVRKKYLTIM